MSPLREAAKNAAAISQAALLGHLEARARGADMVARAARELAAGRRLAADRLGDLLEVDAEHVVQQEGGALERRQAFERQHQRQGDVVDLVLRGLDDRLRQPGADIGLAPVPRRFQLVEAEPGHDAAQKGLRLAHRLAVGVEPAQERLLHHVLGVRDRSEHPVGDADQPRPQRIEGRGGVLRWALAVIRRPGDCVTGWTPRKPTWMRFQPLIATISRVSFTCSSSVNCACSA